MAVGVLDVQRGCPFELSILYYVLQVLPGAHLYVWGHKHLVQGPAVCDDGEATIWFEGG